MNIQTANAFERFWQLGYRRLTPIVPPGAPLSERSSLAKRMRSGRPEDDARGKAPGVMWPDGTWSGFDFVAHESVEADLARWHVMGAGVGIKTGPQPDGTTLLLIDADTPNVASAKIIADTIQARFGALPLRIGNAPKAGYAVRVNGDFPYARIEFGQRDDKGRLKERVEILGEGRQFVAYGIHPTTLQPYRWPLGVPPMAEIPIVTGDAILALLEALRPLLPAASELVREGARTEVSQDALRGSLEAVSAAVRATPNTSEAFPTREAYRDYGYAIKAALPDNPREAFELYADWCERWADGSNPGDVVEADWHRMKPPFRRGASWLFELADVHSGGKFIDGAQWLESEAENTPLFPENLPKAFVTSERKSFTFETLAEAADRALDGGAEPLIDGLLDQGAMTVLYGESNSGKTFVALDMAFHIASGGYWGGMETAKLDVAYIAAEGGQGFRKRVAALRKKHGTAADAGFHVLVHPINLLRADADLGPLIEALRATEARAGRKIGLVVVDTLSRAMSGGDENASTDMGAMVKHLDALRAAVRTHLMVVHHTGKDKARGARGHSLLRAATDTEIEIADRTISVTKQRDLDGAWSSGFDLVVVNIGADVKGRPVSSCCVALVDAAARAVVDAELRADRGEATAKERDVLTAIASLDGLSDDGKPGVKLVDLVGYFLTRGDNMSKETLRTFLRRLLAKGLVERSDRGKWTVKSPENACTAPCTALILDDLSKVETVQGGTEAVQGCFA